MKYQVKIYTTPSCPYCVQLKNYLEGKGIEYEEIDVSENQKAAQEMINISGQMNVPVITIKGQVVVGFDKERIDNILGKS